jgi:DNA-binding CsgD family transcriptional regulator
MDRILDLIYDAAGDDGLWPAALTAIADLTGSEGGILFGQSVSAEQVYFDFNGRLDPECNRIYQERHMQNPWSLAMEVEPVGRVVLSDEVVALNDLKRTAFYDEVLRPQAIGHNAMIALAARNDFRVAFNICRGNGRGGFEAAERQVFETLAPHLRRSVTLGFRLTGYLALRNAAFDVIDKLTDGVVVMGPRGHVLFANQTACSLEAEGTLKLNPSIGTWSPTHSRRLTSLVRSALTGGAGGTASTPSFDSSRLLTVVVVGLRSGELSNLYEARISDAACAAFVIDPLRRETVGAQQLMDAYGLTKAEARVALTASSGRTMAEAGLSLGLSPNTVKTHLSRVFAKTNTGGHAGLVALLATIGVIRADSEGRETK